MKKAVQVKVPINMYNYLKSKSQNNNTSMRIEAGNLMSEYFSLKSLEKKLEGKRGKLIILK